MGQKDLGACVILSQADLSALNANLLKVKFLGRFETPEVRGFFPRRINHRLREYIQDHARKNKADLAVIESQIDFFGFYDSKIYTYSLYLYKK